MNGWTHLWRDDVVEGLLSTDDRALVLYIKLQSIVDYKSGEWSTGRFRLAELTGWKPTTAWDVLQRLKKYKLVTLTSDNKRTVIHICNWSDKQDGSDTTSDNKVTTNRQQSDTNKELRIKELRKDTNVSSSTDVDAKALFSELIGLLGFTDAVKYTEGRRRKLQARIRSSSPAELRKAAQAIADDAYMQGDNPAGRRYGDVDYLIRNDEQVDKWIQRSETKLKDLKEYI